MSTDWSKLPSVAVLVAVPNGPEKKGAGPLETVPLAVEEPLAAGDRLVLTTDGVHGVLDNRWLERLLADSRELADAASDIARAAIARGSRDNCTAVVAQYSRD